jgi:hypothetical protein
MTTKTPRQNAPDSPRVFGTLSESFVRRGPNERGGPPLVVERGKGFGPPPPRASSAPNAVNDGRPGPEVRIIRDPAPSPAGTPVIIVGTAKPR